MTCIRREREEEEEEEEEGGSEGDNVWEKNEIAL